MGERHAEWPDKGRSSLLVLQLGTRIWLALGILNYATRYMSHSPIESRIETDQIVPIETGKEYRYGNSS